VGVCGRQVVTLALRTAYLPFFALHRLHGPKDFTNVELTAPPLVPQWMAESVTNFSPKRLSNRAERKCGFPLSAQLPRDGPTGQPQYIPPRPNGPRRCLPDSELAEARLYLEGGVAPIDV